MGGADRPAEGRRRV